MSERENRTGRPSQELTNHGKVTQNGQHSSERDSAANKSLQERDQFYKAFWDSFIERSSVVPLCEDPALWPANMLVKFNLLEPQRGALINPAKAELAEKLAPIQDSIRRIRMAYQVIAYPHCHEWFRNIVEDDLALDRQTRERDQVTVNDTEMEIIGKLCTTPRYKFNRDGTMTLQPEIPFDPKKRVYKYAEILNPPAEITVKPENQGKN